MCEVAIDDLRLGFEMKTQTQSEEVETGSEVRSGRGDPDGKMRRHGTYLTERFS